MKPRTPTGEPIVYDDGVVVHHGFKIGRVVQLPHSRRWQPILDGPAGGPPMQAHRWQHDAVAALATAAAERRR